MEVEPHSEAAQRLRAAIAAQGSATLSAGAVPSQQQGQPQQQLQEASQAAAAASLATLPFDAGASQAVGPSMPTPLMHWDGEQQRRHLAARLAAAGEVPPCSQVGEAGWAHPSQAPPAQQQHQQHQQREQAPAGSSQAPALGLAGVQVKREPGLPSTQASQQQQQQQPRQQQPDRQQLLPWAEGGAVAAPSLHPHQQQQQQQPLPPPRTQEQLKALIREISTTCTGMGYPPAAVASAWRGVQAAGVPWRGLPRDALLGAVVERLLAASST